MNTLGTKSAAVVASSFPLMERSSTYGLYAGAIVMRLAIILLLSSLGFAQGIGGKAGLGGKSGLGGGLPRVAFDATNATGGRVSAGTTVSVTVTVGSGANRAGAVLVGMSANTATGITCTLAGQAGTLVSGTDSGATRTYRSFIFVAAGLSSGSQTFSCTWTGAVSAVIFAVTATGVDQVTPMNNGTFATGNSGGETISISSNTGDLTVDIANAESGAIPTAPTQTSTSTRQSADFQVGAGCSRGLGTAGPITHAWTTGSGWTASGANFKHA